MPRRAMSSVRSCTSDRSVEGDIGRRSALLESADGAQQRRLACAVRAEDRRDLAGLGLAARRARSAWTAP